MLKKMKNKLIILIICTFFINCTHYITIYSAENKANDAYIWGEDLNVFFNNTNDEINILKIRKKINSGIIKKINNNKSLILKSDYVENLSGRYKYVILLKQDTFYISPSKKSWMLKNHVTLINNDSLISNILKNDEIK